MKKRMLVVAVMLTITFGKSFADRLNHPCLLFNKGEIEQIREKSESTQWLKDMREVVIKDADAMLDLQTEPYLLEDESKHLYFGIAGRGVQVHVLNLALAGYLTDEQKYFDKAKEVLLAVVRQTEPENIKTGSDIIRHQMLLRELHWDMIYCIHICPKQNEVK